MHAVHCNMIVNRSASRPSNPTFDTYRYASPGYITDGRQLVYAYASLLPLILKTFSAVSITGAALPKDNNASAAYHYKWRSIYFELSQTR